jgi:hypothetical protein
MGEPIPKDQNSTMVTVKNGDPNMEPDVRVVSRFSPTGESKAQRVSVLCFTPKGEAT